MTIRVSIVENDRQTRELLAELIGGSRDFDLRHRCANAEACELMAKDDPDVVLIGTCPSDPTRSVLLRCLKRLLPNSKFLLLTDHADGDSLFEALAAGATGYLRKHATREEIFAAIKQLAAGGSPMDSGIARLTATSLGEMQDRLGAGSEVLSAEERAVLSLFGQGYLPREIAVQLGIDERAVDCRVRHIYEQLQEHPRARSLPARMLGLLALRPLRLAKSAITFGLGPLTMNSLLQDLRFSLRVLAKTPGFTAAAVLVLGLGIGLNTAMFSAIYALGFSPRALPEPNRLVQLYSQDKKEPTRFQAFSYPAYRELQKRRDLFSGVLAQKLTLVGVGEGAAGRRAISAVVSANFFEVLGVPPAHGRGFTVEEGIPGADAPVAVVSHNYWRNSGSRPDLVGSTVRVNNRPYTIVGIAPEGFNGTLAMVGPDLYFPLGVFDSLADSGGQARRSLAEADVFTLRLTGKLQPGVTTAAAAAALAGTSTHLDVPSAIESRERTIVLGPLTRSFPDVSPPNEGPIRLVSTVLLGLTGTVLLIVSLNLAGLLLARGHARRKEFAIRLAIGGTRSRLVRQLLTEGLVLALLGGALGCVCAVWGMDLAVTAVSGRLPVELFLSVRSPLPVAIATLAFCLLATLFFALGPALALSRRDLLPDLQQAGGDAAVRRHRWLPRNPLVALQIALSLALMIGAGLFAGIARQATRADTGIDAAHTLVAEFDTSLGGRDPALRLEKFRTVGERLAALPGVTAASIARSTPFSLSGDSREVRRAGMQPAPGSQPATAAAGRAFTIPFNAVGADYFAILGESLLRGRSFTRGETDHAGAPSVAVIDEALAAQLWPGEDALGQRIEWVVRGSRHATASVVSAEVVGIARSRHLELFERKSTGALYLPFAQALSGKVYFFIRSATAGDDALGALREPIRRELQAADGSSFSTVRTAREHQDESLELWLVQRIALLANGFGAFAAFISVVGLYGAKAYSVTRRTREIGIRLALGAEPARLRNLIIREGLSVSLFGIACGLLLGAALGRLLRTLIVEFDGFDPTVFGLAALLLFAVTFVASWLPARQATKVSPTVALRAD